MDLIEFTVKDIENCLIDMYEDIMSDYDWYLLACAGIVLSDKK